MRRGHTAELFVDAVKAFRAKIPEVTISTDVIVGFPSETANDFDRTVQILRLTEPDIVNVSKYGARPGTAAARFKKVDTHTKKCRSKQLHLLVNEIELKRNSEWKDWEGSMVIDGSNGNWLYGRNYAYRPIHVLRPRGKNFRLGEELLVRIREFTGHYLKGCLQNNT
jgi:tRNA A37 methylthiotransferase MiaB